MKSKIIHIITAIIILLIAVIGFLIIYREFNDVPDFKGVFVYIKGVMCI